MSSGRTLVPERIGFGLSLLLFGIPAGLLWLATQYWIPALVARGWEPLVAWFAAGSIVFVPMMAAALAGAWKALERPLIKALLRELRVRPMSSADWRLTLAVLVLTIAAVAALQAINASLWPRLTPHPPFMGDLPLASNQMYILLLWLPFFFFNIAGEELWWRGFIQPRQEPVFGKSTWIVQGVLHGLFHVSFGMGLLFTLVPVLFAIPWAVQRTRNTSTGIVIHAGINGPGFLAVTLGLISA